jgi:hypothetical protein
MSAGQRYSLRNGADLCFMECFEIEGMLGWNAINVEAYGVG